LIVSRLEGEGRVDEVEIDVIELEFLETGLEGGFDTFWTMIVIPELVATGSGISVPKPRAGMAPDPLLRASFVYRSLSLSAIVATLRCLTR
jgi:hypothetical protein